MKKSTILILSAVLIFWLAIAVIKPLDGRVFIDKDNKPKDVISSIIQSLDKSKDYKNASLQEVKYLKIIGNTKRAYIELAHSDSNKVYIKEDNRYVPYTFDKKGDSLIIKLGLSDFKLIAINTNATLNSLILDNISGNLSLVPREGKSTSIENLIIQKQSQIISGNGSREDSTYLKPINIQVKDQSKIEFQSTKFSNVNLKLDNGFFSINKDSNIDSLNADLQGLSNINIGKYPDDKIVKSLVLTGNLDYYNKRKPK